MESILIAFLIVTLATLACSRTLATSPLFQPIRDWLYERSAMWGKLASCSYCLSHWVAALFVGLSGPDLKNLLLPHTYSWVAWALVSYAVVGLCALMNAVFGLLK